MIEYGLTRTGREQAPPDLSAGTVREAMRLGVQPLADRVREAAGQVFAGATSWRDLEAGLAALGYRLERAERGSGLVVTDGSRRCSLSRVDRSLSGPKLAARFSETFREHRERNPEPPQIQRRADGREIAPLEGATPSARTRALIERVTATRATFTEADVQRAAFHEPDGYALAQRVLDRDQIVTVGKDARGVMHFASVEYLRDEARMFSAARELAAREQLRLDPGVVLRALDRVPHLSAEQRSAVVAATTRDDLALIVGRAGAGKTTAAATIADAYREARPGNPSQRTSEANTARAAPTAAAWRRPVASWSGTITTRAPRSVALYEGRHLPAPPGLVVAGRPRAATRSAAGRTRGAVGSGVSPATAARTSGRR